MSEDLQESKRRFFAYQSQETDIYSDDLQFSDFSDSSVSQSEEVVETLRKRMEITQKLVAAFVKLAGQSKPRPVEEIVRKCQDAQSEVRCSKLKRIMCNDPYVGNYFTGGAAVG